MQPTGCWLLVVWCCWDMSRGPSFIVFVACPLLLPQLAPISKRPDDSACWIAVRGNPWQRALDRSLHKKLLLMMNMEQLKRLDCIEAANFTCITHTWNNWRVTKSVSFGTTNPSDFTVVMQPHLVTQWFVWRLQNSMRNGVARSKRKSYSCLVWTYETWTYEQKQQLKSILVFY